VCLYMACFDPQGISMVRGAARCSLGVVGAEMLNGSVASSGSLLHFRSDNVLRSEKDVGVSSLILHIF
jgi:hypothetical protein